MRLTSRPPLPAIYLHGVGTVLVSPAGHTLRARTHVVAERLGLVHESQDRATQQRQEQQRREVEDASTRYFGAGVGEAWRWLDEDGRPAGR